MTDRLILSDPNGNAKLDKMVVALQEEENRKRIQELERNIAKLEKELSAKQKSDHQDGAGSNNKIGARKDGKFKAISTAPSINKTPMGPSMVPIPYPTVQDLDSSESTAKSVNFNGKPAYLLDSSKQLSCKGDERGTGKGVRSGTVSGEVKPTAGSKTVRIEGKQVVRDGDPCTMNGGNNPGIYVTTQLPSTASPKNAISTSNPPISEDPPAIHRGGVSKNRDPNNLLNFRTPDSIEEQIAEMMRRDRADGLGPTQRAFLAIQKQPAGPQLVAVKEGAEELQRLRTKNSLEIALLSVIGLPAAPGAVARLMGADEATVAASNEVGSAAMGVIFSAPGLTAPPRIGRVSNGRPPTEGFDKSSNTGVKITGRGQEGSEATGAPTAAERSASFQGSYPYENIDRMRNIKLEKGKRIAHVTFREDGRPVSEYFTTESAIRRVTLPDGSIDANRLNQGLQIHAGVDPLTGAQRTNFKPFVQYFETTADIPTAQAAMGRTRANPALNPENHKVLPQIFINKEYHSMLEAQEIVTLSNTSTPTYPRLRRK